MMLYYVQNNSNYNSKRTEQNISRANDFINKAQKNSEDSQKYASRAIEFANLAMSTVIPYDSNELKGVWIRPTFYNEKDIISTLDRLAQSGINNIFLETYYHGNKVFFFPVEPKNFTVVYDVFSVYVVIVRHNEHAHVMKNCTYFKKCL